MLERVLLSILLVIAAFGCSEEPVIDVADTESVTTDSVIPTDSGLEPDQWWSYGDWDTNADQKLRRDEFDSRFEGNFTQWDVDGDGALDSEESADAFRDFFDGDDDNIVAQQEWNTGVSRWNFEAVDWSDWSAWDADGDGRLTETEWRERWNESAWTAWDSDGDGLVQRGEMADTFWDFFDGNDDDVIDAGEWGPRG